MKKEIAGEESIFTGILWNLIILFGTNGASVSANLTLENFYSQEILVAFYWFTDYRRSAGLVDHATIYIVPRLL